MTAKNRIKATRLALGLALFIAAGLIALVGAERNPRSLADPKTDVAIIRLKGQVPDDLPTVTLGDSDALQVGSLVLAILQMR